MKKNSLIYILILLGATSVFAQDNNGGEKPNEKKIFTADINIDRTATIQDAKKLSIPIQIDKITVADPDYEYSITPNLFTVNPYYSEPLQPISLGEVKMPETTPGYAVLGVGNYRNAIGELYWSGKSNRKSAYDISLKHRSGKAPARYSGFGNTNLNANYEKIYQKHTLNIGLDTRYNRVHHYGFYSDSIPDSININADTILTDYIFTGVNVSYDNYKSKSDKHKFSVYGKPYYFNSSQGEYEWAAVVGGSLREPLKENMFLNFNLEYDYNSYYENDGSWLRNIVRVGANYNYHNEGLKVKAGFKTASDNVSPPGDTVPSQNSIYVFPDVKATYTFGDDFIQAYAAIGGGLNKNSLFSVTSSNPFVKTDLHLQNTVERINVSGGIKGNLFRELNYNFYATYRNMDKMLLFANIDSSLNYFTTIYTGTNTGVFQIGAELSYKQYERLLINLKTNYYQYSFVNNLAWNLPSFDLRLNARYNFQEKIIATFNAFAIDTRVGTNASRTTTYNMPYAFDLGLGVDYQFNSKTYLYLKANNLLHQKYMMWNGYPVQGFHLLGGVKIQF